MTFWPWGGGGGGSGGGGTTVSGTTEKSWAFTSPSGSSGTFYVGGYYIFAGSDNDFSPSANFGTANLAYAAHLFVVLGAATVDELTIRVTGTSITGNSSRIGGDTEDIVIPSGTNPNAYFETSKKWLGQVAIETISGTAKTCNYGFDKYWDNINTNFRVVGFEATFTGGANDATPDFIIRHHSENGWTFNGGAAPTPPAGIASMSADVAPERQIGNGVMGAWKRTNLDTFISGATNEGTIIEIITTSNKTIQFVNFILSIRAA